MNRRNFLKRIGQTIAGLLVAPSVLKAKKKEPKLTEDMIVKSFNDMPQSNIEFIAPMAQIRLEYLRQNIIRFDEEHEEVMSNLKRYNFPKEYIMD